MGMYDVIRCEYPLPGEPPEEVKQIALSGQLQTKSFDSEMELYTITVDGRLVHTEYETACVPEEQRYYYGKPEWELGGFYRLVGCVKRTPYAEVEMSDFHGDISFCAMTQDYEFIDYTARFTEGKLMFIREVNNGKIERFQQNVESSTN